MTATIATLTAAPADARDLDPIFANHLRIASFASDLSDRLLRETGLNDEGQDDEYLRGYARAMSDIAEALMAGEMRPGGSYFPEA